MSTTISSLPKQSTRTHSRTTRPPRRLRFGTVLAMAFLFVMSVYFLLPLYWLLVAATKSNADISGTFGLWFSQSFNLWDNLHRVFTNNDGAYSLWLFNSFFYSFVSAAVGTLFSSLAGYALAKFTFKGRNLIFSIILGAILVPTPALVLPLYLLMNSVHLTNTYWAIILPSIVSPFGVYLSRIYADTSIPDALLDAARVDGASEMYIFFSIVLRVISPALITVFMFQFVGVWTNYFLQYVMISNTNLYPVTVGLQLWNSSANSGGIQQYLYSILTTGSLVSILPLLIGFLLLQRYWRNGLTLGSVVG